MNARGGIEDWGLPREQVEVTQAPFPPRQRSGLLDSIFRERLTQRCATTDRTALRRVRLAECCTMAGA